MKLPQLGGAVEKDAFTATSATPAPTTSYIVAEPTASFPSATVQPDAPSGGAAQAAINDGSEHQGPDSAPQTAGTGSDDQVQSIPTKSPPQYPRLSAHLNRLVAAIEAGQTTAEQAAQGAPIHNEASVAVTIHLSAHVDDVVAYLEDNGGDPRNVGVDYIEAYVPVPLLAPVSEQPGVTRVREIIPPQAAQGGPASSP